MEGPGPHGGSGVRCMLYSLSWPELLLGLAFLLLVANAARRGFLREGSLLLGLGLALWSAGRLYPYVGGLLLRGEANSPWGVVSYLGLVIVLLILAAGLSALAAPLIKRGPLQTVDRAAGLVVGLGEATLLVGLLAMAGERFGAFRVPPDGPAARAVEVAGIGFAWLAATIPVDILALTGLK
jgi:uncharacterized membrane protein required for colicin V production